MRLSEKEIYKAIRRTRFRAHCDQFARRVGSIQLRRTCRMHLYYQLKSQFVIRIDPYVMAPAPSQGECCEELTTENGKCRLYKLTVM